MNREEWLSLAAFHLSKLLDAEELTLPPIAISVGFPKGARGGGGARAIGQCFCPTIADDEKAHIFVSPEIGDPIVVLATVLHELVHASVGVKWLHKRPFREAASKLGLEGKPTATYPGEALRVKLGEISEALGPYPHGPLRPITKERKGSPLRLWECGCKPKAVKARVASDDFEALCMKCKMPFDRAGGGK